MPATATKKYPAIQFTTIRSVLFACVICLLVYAPIAHGQEANPFSRLNTWSASAEFVPTTTHIFMGQSEARRFIAIGGEYDRRIRHRRLLDLYYVADVRPVILEGDPTLLGFENIATNQPVLRIVNPQRVEFINHSTFLINFFPENVRVRSFYGREWTYAAGVSPLGIRMNFLPRRRWQPFLDASGGLQFSARDVPVDGAGSFNFTFGYGCGVEWYTRPGRSMRFEFLLRHASNAYTAPVNPGVDTPTLRIAYSFDR